MSMTREEVLLALVDERPLQRKDNSGKWVDGESVSTVIGWLASDCGRTQFPEHIYRIKPTPVPPGDLTMEQAKELQKQGVAVEWMNPGFGDWETQYSEVGSCKEDPNFAWRRKPTPRMVPLGPEDVDLHRDLFKWAERDASGTQIANGMSETGIWIGNASVAVSWKEAQLELLRSINGGKTWTRCEKEVVE